MNDKEKMWWQTGRSVNIIGIVLLVLVGCFDYSIFYEIDMGIFYLLPIAWIAWYGEERMEMGASLVALLLWSGCDILEGHGYSSSFIFLWAIGMHGAAFLGAGVLLRRLQEALLEAQNRADHDFLTSLPNRQCFYRLARYTIDKSRKQDKPLAIAYLDVDHFKQVNDTMGHDVGDKLLKCVATYLQRSVRKTDIVARLGGDEFVMLLPHTDLSQAQQVLTRVQEELQKAVDTGGWPVTFSIGACIFIRPPEEIDQLLRRADGVMYGIKHDGKNQLRCAMINQGEEIGES